MTRIREDILAAHLFMPSPEDGFIGMEKAQTIALCVHNGMDSERLRNAVLYHWDRFCPSAQQLLAWLFRANIHVSADKTIASSEPISPEVLEGQQITVPEGIADPAEVVRRYRSVDRMISAVAIMRNEAPPISVGMVPTLQDAVKLAIFSLATYEEKWIFTTLARWLVVSSAFHLFEGAIKPSAFPSVRGCFFEGAAALVLQGLACGQMTQEREVALASLFQRTLELNDYGFVGDRFAAKCLETSAMLLLAAGARNETEWESLALTRLHLLDRALEQCPVGEHAIRERLIDERMQAGSVMEPAPVFFPYASPIGVVPPPVMPLAAVGSMLIPWKVR